MGQYKSQYTGPQIDAGINAALNPDVAVTPDSDALVTSGAVADALDNIDPTITSNTDTTLNGILVGDGGKVGTKSLDTSSLTNDADHVPVSNVVKSAISAFVRPNLLDNANFVGGGSQQGGGQFPINQRGQASYFGGGGVYTLDRWKYETSGALAMNLQSDGVAVGDTGANVIGVLSQFIENPLKLAGRTLTFSALVKDCSGSGSHGFLRYIVDNVEQPTVGFITSDGLTSFSFTVPSSLTTSMRFDIGVYWGYYFKLLAAKLELGDSQTLAHQENGQWVLNEIPSYQQELAKCQRYFQTFRTQSLRPTYGADFRPVMATATPSLGTITIDGITYYTASSDL